MKHVIVVIASIMAYVALVTFLSMFVGGCSPLEEAQRECANGTSYYVQFPDCVERQMAFEQAEEMRDREVGGMHSEFPSSWTVVGAPVIRVEP